MSYFTFLKHYILLGLILLSSCNAHNENTKEAYLQVNLSEASKNSKICASDVISDIEYVALETSDECLLDYVVRFSISENYILTYSGKNCFLFSRTGKFIRKIGQKGQGPEDHLGGLYNVKIRETTGDVYLMGTGQIYLYKITGEFVKKLNLFELSREKGLSGLRNTSHWKDDLFCSNIDLFMGNEPYRFVVYTLDGEIVKLFDNFLLFDVFDSYTAYVQSAKIYNFNDKLFVKEILCDTLFQITDKFELEPEVVYKLPGKKIPTAMRGRRDKPFQERQIHALSEVENYQCISSIDYYLYDKKNKLATIIEPHPTLMKVTKTNPMYGIESRTIPYRGLINDIDGGLPFWPDDFSHIQNNRQLACIYHAYEFKEKLTEAYLAEQNIKDKEAHQRLRSLLSHLNEDDNPVLMIATFK